MYLVVSVLAVAGIAAGEAGSLAGQHISVDVNGNYTGPGSPAGVLGVLAAVATPAFYLTPLFWPAFVVHQVRSWRRSDGDGRQQLKWLMSGAVLALAGVMVIAFGPRTASFPAGLPGTRPSCSSPRCRSASASGS